MEPDQLTKKEEVRVGAALTVGKQQEQAKQTPSELELLKAQLAQLAQDNALLLEAQKRQQDLHKAAQLSIATGTEVKQPCPAPGTEVIFTNHAGKFEHAVVVDSSEYDGCVLNVTGVHPADKQRYEFVKVGRKGTRGTYHVPTPEELEKTLAPFYAQQKQIKDRAEYSALMSREVVQKKVKPGDKRPEVPEFAPVLVRA